VKQTTDRRFLADAAGSNLNLFSVEILGRLQRAES
jgi:hypothetical protein